MYIKNHVVHFILQLFVNIAENKERSDGLGLVTLEPWAEKWLETMDCLKDGGDTMDPKEPFSRTLEQVLHVG